MKKLSILILNYKTPELTINCINSLIKQFKPELKSNKMEILVLDNGSNDNSYNEIKKSISSLRLKNIYIYINKTNLGFGRGCNYLAERSKSKYILFLNSDTLTLDKGLSEMLDYIDKHKDIGIIGGKVIYPDGSAQLTVGKYFNLLITITTLLGLYKIGKSSPNKIVEAEWVGGSCMLVNKSIFKKIHGFDPNIFMYVEDLEICYRIHRLGYKVIFYPFTKVIHKEYGSSNKSFAIPKIFYGYSYFFKKHKPYWEYLVFRFLLKTKAFIIFNIGGLINNKFYYKTYKEAFNES